MKLSTKQLEAFITLEETMRFAAAAERCHISTSAFSQIISRLEEEVGAQLFDRNPKHVALTPEGEAFALSARRIMAEINNSMSELRARIAGHSGQVSIAATPTPCVSWLPNLMSQFRSNFPNLTLRLHDAVSERCLEQLRQAYVDFAVVAQAGDESEFESIPLFDEPFYLLCRHDDPLTKNSALFLAQLKGCNHIQVIGKGALWDQRKRDLREAGVCETGFEVANFGTLAGLVTAGFGVGLIPRMALPLCRREELVALSIKDKSFIRTFYLVKRRNRSLSVAANKLANFLQRKGIQEKKANI